MSLTLVILAAGMGSRYGGLKQMDEVGPSGETILDFATEDARRAGFDRVLFVIRRDFEEIFRSQIGGKYAGKIRVDYAFQSIDALPPGFSAPEGRVKPWGTGHAVWCARGSLLGPFAVINADDFYGYDSFTQLASFLKQPPSPARPHFAMVGFRLRNTLSENGAVSRGVCSVEEGGVLRSVVENTGIIPANVGEGKVFTGEEIVSMNCWGFSPALFPALDRRFTRFLEAYGSDFKAEFYLPAAVSGMIADHEVDVRVLPTKGSWFGITHREDKARVAAAIRAMIESGQLRVGA